MGNVVPMIEASLVQATPLSNGPGWTWTLASRLGHMLRKAEGAFGPRDPSYTILGVEFGGDIPQIWYPGNCGHVIVQITPSCATDPYRAWYQMAHEVIHLLSPSGSAVTTVLDEGLATHFQLSYMREEFGQDQWCPDVHSYIEAQAAVEKVLSIDVHFVKNLRKNQPALWKASAADILQAVPAIPKSLAAQLATPFAR